jgi:hypothetical protein
MAICHGLRRIIQSFLKLNIGGTLSVNFALKISDLLSGFLSISLGVRILIGTVIGALGSSTLIGFIADLGAVNYALAYGARLPTEGVPYLVVPEKPLKPA